MMADGAANNRAIAYVRVSTTRQAEEGNSIASQQSRIKGYADMRGLRILSKDVIIDDGVSGGVPFLDRKGGALAMDRIDSGRYGHLIVMNIERLSREQVDAVQTIDALEDIGIAIHFVDWWGSSINTKSPHGRFILQVIASLAEMERGVISERTRQGMEYLRRNMLRFTRSLFGWNVRKDDSLVPNWKEQDLIDYMVWQMDGNDISATAVARSLNKRGSTGKEGGKWQSSSVINVAYNDFHESRNDFPLPKNWGKRTWHRKEIIPENETIED